MTIKYFFIKSHMGIFSSLELPHVLSLHVIINAAFPISVPPNSVSSMIHTNIINSFMIRPCVGLDIAAGKFPTKSIPIVKTDTGKMIIYQYTFIVLRIALQFNIYLLRSTTILRYSPCIHPKPLAL